VLIDGSLEYTVALSKGIFNISAARKQSGAALRLHPYQNTGVEWGSIVVLDIWARLSRQENLKRYFQIKNE